MKIILNEDQFSLLLNEIHGKEILPIIMEENLKYCYIGSFFVFELPNFPNIKRYYKGSKEGHTDEINETTIGDFLGKSQYDVFVYSNDEGNIPHVHVLDHATMGEEFDCCVRLDCAEYFMHGHHNSKFNARQKKAFNKFMHSNLKTLLFDKTKYEFSVLMWNMNNSNVSVDVVTDTNNKVIIPDYLELN